MKESNTIAANAAIKQQREILLNTKFKFLNESNKFAGNVIFKSHFVCLLF